MAAAIVAPETSPRMLTQPSTPASPKKQSWRRPKPAAAAEKTGKTSTRPAKVYRCPHCPDEPPYAGASGLWYHMKRHHGARTRPYNSKKRRTEPAAKKSGKQQKAPKTPQKSPRKRQISTANTKKIRSTKKPKTSKSKQIENTHGQSDANAAACKKLFEVDANVQSAMVSASSDSLKLLVEVSMLFENAAARLKLPAKAKTPAKTRKTISEGLNYDDMSPNSIARSIAPVIASIKVSGSLQSTESSRTEQKARPQEKSKDDQEEEQKAPLSSLDLSSSGSSDNEGDMISKRSPVSETPKTRKIAAEARGRHLPSFPSL